MSDLRSDMNKRRDMTIEEILEAEFGPPPKLGPDLDHQPELKPPYLDRQRLGAPQNKPHTRRYGR
jgi:hypothetical protein